MPTRGVHEPPSWRVLGENDLPPGTAKSVAAVQDAFEAGGVEFTNGEARGVRLAKRESKRRSKGQTTATRLETRRLY